jgi:uncharacterized protein YggE
MGLLILMFGLSSAVIADTRLEARGAGFVDVTPDQVMFSASVTEINLSAVDAQKQVNGTVARMEEALVSFDIEQDSIDSSGLTLNPEYRWDSDSRKQVFVGYRATRTLKFTANGVSEIGAIMSSLTRSGATQVTPPKLAYSKPDNAQQQALRNAVENALSVVRTMASAAELTIQGINSIGESKGYSAEPFESLMRAEPASAVDAAPEVSVSTLRYTAEVSIVATAN